MAITKEEATFVLHDGPAHPDEIYAMAYIIWMHRQACISLDYELAYSRNGRADDVDASSLRGKVYYLGVGGKEKGPFDEHERTGGATVRTECCATLVAKYYGNADAAWGMILDDVLRLDRGEIKGGGRFGLQALCARAWRLDDGTNAFSRDIIDVAIGVALMDHEDVAHMLESEHEYNANVRTVTYQGFPWRDGTPQEIRLGVIESDNGYIKAWAMNPRGGNRNILVLKSPTTGNVQIFSAGPSLRSAARAFRLMEQWWYEGKDPKTITTDWTELGLPGNVGSERWWFEGHNLMNGCLSHPGTAPTGIPLEVIVSTLQFSTSPWMPPKQGCANGQCAGKVCPWYWLGVGKCRSVRHEAAQDG